MSNYNDLEKMSNMMIISNHYNLMQRIATLKMDKAIQENELKASLTDIVSTLDVLAIFKGAIRTDRPLELTKSGVNMVLELIIDLILGKHRSIKGYLSATMVEKFTTMLVNNNILKIISGISSLFNRKSQYERSQE